MDINMEPIGYVRNGVTEKKDGDWGKDVSTITLVERYAPGIVGLEGFSHAIVVFLLDQANFVEERHLIRRPRNRADMPQVGIFAQRAKDRPNRIGTTVAEIVSVGDGELRVRGLDAIDKTPVLDIKPYYPAYDRRDATTPAWVDRLMEDYF